VNVIWHALLLSAHQVRNLHRPPEFKISIQELRFHQRVEQCNLEEILGIGTKKKASDKLAFLCAPSMGALLRV
jgi:hypothetical protein